MEMPLASNLMTFPRKILPNPCGIRGPAAQRYTGRFWTVFDLMLGGSPMCVLGGEALCKEVHIFVTLGLQGGSRLDRWKTSLREKVTQGKPRPWPRLQNRQVVQNVLAELNGL
jgi:hypothetical protein